MSDADHTWIVAVAIIPTVFFVCSVFICIGIRYALKKAKREHPATGDVDTPPSGRQRAVPFPVFTQPLEVNILTNPPPPYDYYFVPPSNEMQTSSIAMETTPHTPPPLYQETDSNQSSIQIV